MGDKRRGSRLRLRGRRRSGYHKPHKFDREDGDRTPFNRGETMKWSIKAIITVSSIQRAKKVWIIGVPVGDTSVGSMHRLEDNVAYIKFPVSNEVYTNKACRGWKKPLSPPRKTIFLINHLEMMRKSSLRQVEAMVFSPSMHIIEKTSVSALEKVGSLSSVERNTRSPLLGTSKISQRMEKGNSIGLSKR